MPEVHLPHLDDHDDAPADASSSPTHAGAPAGSSRRRGSLLKLGVEVLLISTGVFLGLMGEQWRENAHRRELAEQALRRFRTEIIANRKEVAEKFAYHAPLAKKLRVFLAADAKGRQNIDLELHGVQPPSFEHTAWDLALATQSLANINENVAFLLSTVYTYQARVAQLGGGMLQAMYMAPPSGNLEQFLRSVDLYYGDLVLMEPTLLRMYDEALPQVDRALEH